MPLKCVHQAASRTSPTTYGCSLTGPHRLVLEDVLHRDLAVVIGLGGVAQHAVA